MAITINYNTEKFKVKDIRKIKKWINEVVISKGKKVGSINYIFCNDDYILEINKQYLNHNYYTDIITFDYSEKGKLEGDIFISIDTVRSNAIKYKSEFNEELLRVIIHGILHLSGLNDKTKEEKIEMRKAENEALNIFMK